MPRVDADVIIIGAGPAGSAAALYLAVAGVKVIILEKEEFPRYKVCGGGLTHKIINEIPFDLSPVIRTTIDSVRFSMNFSEVFTRTSPVPLMYCTMRPELDDFLVKKSVDAGAKIQTGETVKAVSIDGSRYRILTNGNEYSATLVIGADGASGIVARTFDLRKNISKGLAWEAELDSTQEYLDKYRTTVFLDWGTFPGGYGWIFPKKDHFSVGVGGPAAFAVNMMPYYLKFLSSTGIFNIGTTTDPVKIPGTHSLKSWPIPVRTKKSKFHHNGVMIVGDAAGLTDPLTGEGIYYAVVSGKFAAQASLAYLCGKINATGAYTEKVNEVLMPELLEAEKICNIFNTSPQRIHHYVRDSDRAWRAFGKVLRGERWYADVRNGFGRWKALWNLACLLGGVYRQCKEKKFRKRVF